MLLSPSEWQLTILQYMARTHTQGRFTCFKTTVGPRLENHA